MLLAIDIGNTHTVVGLFKDRMLINHWRITSDLGRTEDEIGVMLHYLFHNEGYRLSQLSGACISSVVPDLTPIYKMMCKRYLQVEPLVITADLKLDLQIKYREPEMVGADRLCNAVAGKEKYGQPLIIIDFGTATTFDCVDSEGDYLGGVIAPGLNTSIETLHRRAAKLPRVELKFPEQIIGRNTTESIQSGILFGAVFTLEGMIGRIRAEALPGAKVVATGGLAQKISSQTRVIDFIDKYLSLEGIASIYYKNIN